MICVNVMKHSIYIEIYRWPERPDTMADRGVRKLCRRLLIGGDLAAVFVVIILFAASYYLGVYHNTRGFVIPSPGIPPASGTCKFSPVVSRASLDFAANHAAAELGSPPDAEENLHDGSVARGPAGVGGRRRARRRGALEAAGEVDGSSAAYRRRFRRQGHERGLS